MFEVKKIIFLDIDGVLSSRNFLKHRIKPEDKSKYSYLDSMIDKNAVKNLQKIVNKTNAEIVISSIVRINLYNELVEVLKKEKELNANIIGCTPILKTFRGVEIYQWIRDNIDYLRIDSASNFHSYLILDDDSDMLYFQKDNFIKVNNKNGLTKKYIRKSVHILNKK